MTPRQFFYPRVAMDFYQTMTTRALLPSISSSMDARVFQRLGAQQRLFIFHMSQWTQQTSESGPVYLNGTWFVPYLEGLHQIHIIRKELPFGMLLVDVLLRSNIFPLQHLVQRQGAILEALCRISEGFYFGPYHLIKAILFHFEEKVHRKRLQRADHIPLLFSRLLCHILEHMGYPTEPHLERHHHC